MPLEKSQRLPWDLEQAMSAFQVDGAWYEQYWLKPPKPQSPGMIARLFRKAKWSASRTTHALKRALAAIEEGGGQSRSPAPAGELSALRRGS